MGYMGLSCITDSDMAADAAFVADKALVAALRKKLKERANSWNTGGVENVSLYLEERIKDASSSEELSMLVKDVIIKLEEMIEQTRTEDWDDADNKRMHLNAYRRMLRNIKKIPVWDLDI